MSVGERILIIRDKTSREKFAVMTEISKNTLVNYEKGENSPPAEYLNRILQKHCDINPTWLLTGEGPMLKGNRQVNSVTGSLGIGFVSGGKAVGISNGGVGASIYADDVREIADLLEEHFSKAFRKKLLLDLIEKLKKD